MLSNEGVFALRARNINKAEEKGGGEIEVEERSGNINIRISVYNRVAHCWFVCVENVGEV